MVHSEVIVVGSGGAGAMAALAAASAGAQVLLLTSGTVGRSGLTPTGNGGYVAPLHPRDNPEDLCKHLVRFGHYLNDQNLVETLVNEAVAGLKRLEALGVTVRWPAIEDVPPGGRFPRSVLVPGTEVLRILRRHLYSSSSVKVVEDVTVTKLLTHDGAVVGCAGYAGRSGACFLAFGKALVLATGGLGELWSVSTNAPMGISTGSYGWGYSMAAEVGAELIDMEQIQFLPVPAKPRLGRNVRYLPHGPFENGRGERFLARDLDPYSPDLVLAIWQQCTKGLGPVRIDLTSGATPSYFEGSDHPAFRRKLRTFERLGVDPRQQPVELAIGSHYCQGGGAHRRKVCHECTRTVCSGRGRWRCDGRVQSWRSGLCGHNRVRLACRAIRSAICEETTALVRDGRRRRFPRTAGIAEAAQGGDQTSRGCGRASQANGYVLWRGSGWGRPREVPG